MNDHTNLRALAAQLYFEITVDRADLAALLVDYDALRAAATAKKPRAKKAAPTEGAGPVLPDWLPLEAWAAFLAMRVKIKKPATEFAQKLLLKKLAAFYVNDQDPEAILNQSIMNDWQDLYAPKDGQRGVSMPGGRKVAHVETDAARDERRSRWGIPDAPY